MIKKMKNSNLTFIDIIIYTFAFIGPLSTTFLDIYNVTFSASLFLLITFLMVINKKKLYFNEASKLLIFSYVSFSLISLLSAFFSLYKITSESYFMSIMSRLGTITLSIIILLTISSWIYNQSKEKLIIFIKICFLSTLIFAFLGIYQILSFKYNLPFIETRSSVYGASYEVQENLGFRLTSITREPNFYAPLLIESLLISFVFLKRSALLLFISLSLFLIYKTYSTGAYMHFALLFFFFILFYFKRKTTKIAFMIASVFLLAAFTYSLILQDSYFIKKLNDEINGNSSRSLIYLIIIENYFYSNVLHLIFGYGNNTLQIFSELTNTNYNINFSVSNSLYIDVLWDSGILGLSLFLFGFFRLFLRLYKLSHINKFGKITLLLFISLIITSLYRSEYTTTHFTWVCSIILVCYQLAITVRKESETKYAVCNIQR